MPEYQDTTLSPGTTYFYRVVALNSAGASAPSAALSVSTPSGLPAAPTGLTASATSTTAITLAWNASSGATSYKLQRSASPAGTFTTIITTAERAYTNTGLTPATAYYYRVLATNAAGDSVPSSVASATTLQDTPPPGPGGTCPSSSIKVNPGDNIKAIIEGANSGQTICIAPGTYQGTFIKPQNNVTIMARDPAVRTKVKSLAIRNSNGSIYKTIDAYQVRPTVHIHGYPLNTTNPGSLASSARGRVFDLEGQSGITFDGIEMSRAYGTSASRTSPERTLGRLIHDGQFVARNCWFHRSNQAASSNCGPATVFENCEFGPQAAGVDSGPDRFVNEDSLGSTTYLGCCGGGVKSANGFTAHHCWNHDNDENGFWSDTPGGSGPLIVHDCFVERIGYSAVRFENTGNNGAGCDIYDSVFLDSGYLAPGQNKSHVGGVTINSSINAKVHHCRFGGNTYRSIDLSGDGKDNTGAAINPGHQAVEANLHDLDLGGNGSPGGTYSCSSAGITCSNLFNA